MWTISKKEFLSFFSSLIGLGLLSVFFLTIGLYSWSFEGNIFELGFAELSTFIELSPWFFMFFIPALCMKLFSEEFENGTFYLLKSIPITVWKLVLGKCFGAYWVVFCCLFPTLIYVYSIGQLGSPKNNFDASLLIGGYLSILLITFVFILLSTLASSLTSKQPLAFLLGVFFNFFFWQVPDELKNLVYFDFFNFDINSLKFHFMQMSKGVLDLKDLLFFIGFDAMVLSLLYLRVLRK
jgi:ABC-2 type transport system permease protein